MGDALHFLCAGPFPLTKGVSNLGGLLAPPSLLGSSLAHAFNWSGGQRQGGSRGRQVPCDNPLLTCKE